MVNLTLLALGLDLHGGWQVAAFVGWEIGMRTMTGLVFAAAVCLTGGMSTLAHAGQFAAGGKPQAACQRSSTASAACGARMCFKPSAAQSAFSPAPRAAATPKPVQLAMYCPRAD